MELRFTTTKPDGSENQFISFPLPCGKQIDRGLELMEMLSPILGVGFAQAIGGQSSSGDELARVARAIMAQGGVAYIATLFSECKLSKNGTLIKTVNDVNNNFERGSEVIKVLLWVMDENFADFLPTVLGSSGQAKAGES